MSRRSEARTSYTNAHRRNAFEALTGEAPPSILRSSSRTSRSSAIPQSSYTDRPGSSYADTVLPDDSISVAAARREATYRLNQRSSYHSDRHSHASGSRSRHSSRAYEDEYHPRILPHKDSVTGSYRQSIHGYPTRRADDASIRTPSRIHTHINDDDSIESYWSDHQNDDATLIDRYSRSYNHTDYDEDEDEESDPETPKAYTSRPPTSYHPRAPSRSGESSYSSSHSRASKSAASSTRPPTSFRYTRTLGNSDQDKQESSRRGSTSKSSSRQSRSGSVSAFNDPPRRPTSHYDGKYDTVSSHSSRSRSRRSSQSRYDDFSDPLSRESDRSLARSASISESKSRRSHRHSINSEGLSITRRDDGRMQWDRPKNRTGEPAKRKPGDPPNWLLWLAGGA